jgi:hypothetical protein
MVACTGDCVHLAADITDLFQPLDAPDTSFGVHPVMASIYKCDWDVLAEIGYSIFQRHTSVRHRGEDMGERVLS